ncbi:AzlD family protein [Saccharospirillum salsuginis]|uniref:Branched-chain amino acid transporter n=1 Tax=Saccharospirillum salsuginis TaxID=418750 RepID=A0A918KHF0_9GAMM|nr:AzlD domain-containing protein [Saccharospirillum salsuginis]GGX63025.1 branched-chain amino acid transporter [Saccharospirillum salsuginis]
MSLSVEGYGGLILIGLMAIVTLITRFGGVLVMSFIPISPRVESFINAMSGSVLIAILVPIAVEGDTGARLALVATAVVMLVVKRPMPAIAAGIATAAGWRFLFG